MIMDLSGQSFGRLTVVGFAGNQPRVKWQCVCQCGKQVTVVALSLRNGMTQSCGCLRNETSRARLTTHGLSHRAEHWVWTNMLQRCTNPRSADWPNWGGRGITVCARWEKFENFYADMGDRPPSHTLERQRSNEGYSKDNCVWATRKVQARNTRRNRNLAHNGRVQCLAAWAEELGVNPRTLHTRLSRGWSVEEALTGRRE